MLLCFTKYLTYLLQIGIWGNNSDPFFFAPGMLRLPMSPKDWINGWFRPDDGVALGQQVYWYRPTSPIHDSPVRLTHVYKFKLVRAMPLNTAMSPGVSGGGEKGCMVRRNGVGEGSSEGSLGWGPGATPHLRNRRCHDSPVNFIAYL